LEQTLRGCKFYVARLNINLAYMLSFLYVGGSAAQLLQLSQPGLVPDSLDSETKAGVLVPKTYY